MNDFSTSKQLKFVIQSSMGTNLRNILPGRSTGTIKQNMNSLRDAEMCLE